MNVQVIYASNHGKTKQVADKFTQAENAENCTSLHGDVVIFLCPTYGDEELPFAMEDFLIKHTNRNKQYVICELGNYYGYDDFQFGARSIIEKILIQRGWLCFYKNLSLDSMPQIDWNVFYKWKEGLDDVLRSKSQQ